MRNWQLKPCPASISAGENQRNFQRGTDGHAYRPQPHPPRALISII